MSGLGLDATQLRDHVIRPSLAAIGLWSREAEALVLGTGIVESQLKYVKQLGSGPALGIFQMEPFTHNDLWRNYLWGTALGMDVGNLTRSFGSYHPRAQELTGNLNYAAAMCRVHYRRIREPLPSMNAMDMARYWKRYYNTHLGKGTVEKAIPAFAIAVNMP